MGIQRWNYDTQRALMVNETDGEYVAIADHEQVVADLNAARNHDRKLLQLADENIARLRAELAAKIKDAERLHRAIGIVCEGFTLPPDVYKILTKAMWSDAEIGEGNGR